MEVQNTDFGAELIGAYGRKDIATLKRLLASTKNQLDRFLVLYRLYPLTQDESLIQNIPTGLASTASARELALLAALWSYRINEDKTLLISAGMRMDGLIKAAGKRNSQEPFYLLIDGQSYFYRPNMFGGSYEKALQRFTACRDALIRTPISGMDRLDAEVWIWLTMHKMKASNANSFKQELLKRNLPAVYREFLLSPP